MILSLIGYRYSVYSWIAKLALVEKGIVYEWVETDPFAADLPDQFLTLSPFKRVPVLQHADFSLYETVAITRYVDEAFAGPDLQPSTPVDRARQSQILSIIDSYAYWPFVRQVFAQGFFAPQFGERVDPDAGIRDNPGRYPFISNAGLSGDGTRRGGNDPPISRLGTLASGYGGATGGYGDGSPVHGSRLRPFESRAFR